MDIKGSIEITLVKEPEMQTKFSVLRQSLFTVIRLMF